MRITPTARSSSSGWRRFLATLLALTAALAIALLAPAPASAHAVLIDSSPTDGETLTEVPTEVSVTFNETLIDIGGEVAVVDASQTDWTADEFTFDGPTATAPLTEGMPDGNYEFRWQVVSADGHPISGIIPFSIAAGSAPAESTEPAASDEPAGSGSEASADASADDAETAAQSADADATGEADDATTESTGIFGGIPQPWRTLLIAVIGAAIALGIVAIVVTLRRRSVRTGTSAASAPGGAPADADADAAEDDTTPGDDTAAGDRA